MDENQFTEDYSQSEKSHPLEGILWLILVFLLAIVAITLISRNWKDISSVLVKNPNLENFDSMLVSNGFHHIQLQNGQSWDLSYEANHERNFAGVVRHSSLISEPQFAILSHDILVTSQDFADPSLVETSVSNHHFTWYSSTSENPIGTINLLHTVPMNEEIKQQLDAIQLGDQVVITGWDIYRIDGFDSDGNSIGFWQDSGCNTTLVIAVEILQ